MPPRHNPCPPPRKPEYLLPSHPASPVHPGPHRIWGGHMGSRQARIMEVQGRLRSGERTYMNGSAGSVLHGGQHHEARPAHVVEEIGQGEASARDGGFTQHPELRRSRWVRSWLMHISQVPQSPLPCSEASEDPSDQESGYDSDVTMFEGDVNIFDPVRPRDWNPARDFRLVRDDDGDRKAMVLATWVSTYIHRRVTSRYSADYSARRGQDPDEPVGSGATNDIYHFLRIYTHFGVPYLSSDHALPMALWYITRLPLSPAFDNGRANLAFIDFRRALVDHRGDGVDETIMRVFLVGSMLADLMLNEVNVPLGYWMWSTGLSSTYMKELEKQALRVLNHNLHIRPETWRLWLAHLRDYHSQYVSKRAKRDPQYEASCGFIDSMLDDTFRCFTMPRQQFARYRPLLRPASSDSEIVFMPESVVIQHPQPRYNLLPVWSTL